MRGTMKRLTPKNQQALKITVIYLLLGILWIFFSDLLLLQLLPDLESIEVLFSLQTWKGWFFVLSTALVLFFLARNALADREQAYEQLAAAQTGLIESQRKINHLLDANPTILYALRITDDGTETLFVSSSGTRILGYTEEEMMAPDWWQNNLHPDDREAAQQAFEEILVSSNGVHQYRFLSKTGQTLWIRDQTRLIRDDDGNYNQVIGSWVDVTDKLEEEQNRKLFTTAFDQLGEGMLITDAELKILSVNKAAEHIFGYSQGELLGQSPRMLQSGQHDSYFYETLRITLARTGLWHGEIRDRCRDGTIKPLWLSICTIPDTKGQPYRYVAIYTDISDLKHSEAELQFLAHHDPLTRLPNRALLADRIKHALSHAQRMNHWIAVLFIDLDDFKSVNDSMGHTVGDELLGAVAKRFLSRTRAGDTLARLGGDEFVILAEHLETPDDAAVIAGSMLDILKTPFQLQDSLELYVDACIGISLYPQHGNDLESLMRYADTAMYNAKQQGRGSYSLYTREMSQTVSSQLDIETALRQGMEREELVLHYQPKLDLNSDSLSGAEALIRWSREPGKLVNPADFIPIAEKSGLIIPIGTWVIHAACRQIRAWSDQGIEPVNVAVNISVKQFRSREQDLYSIIVAAIEKYAIEPGQLNLEITETALMEYPQHVTPILQALKKIGINIALDDFGTGFSNMAYLSQLSLDALKIDISFIKGIGKDSNAEALVRSVIDLAHNLGLRTIAEGVETEQQRQFLAHHGCDELQGYLYSKPLTEEDFQQFLQRQNPVRN
ncbi:MAG: EAL domain-containing protein [Pseudomonadales bacterium]|nr:EAL domain-containing protein [Pseudomonadales bacterium]